MKSLAKTTLRPKEPVARIPRPIAVQHDAQEDIRDAVVRLKRERIVATAVDLFWRQGYARTTLDQVAAALHVTKPFIYQFFKSKSELLADICGRAIKVAHEALDRAVVHQGTPTAQLKSIARDFMQTVLQHQGHAVIYSREEKELPPQDREAIRALRRKFDHRLVDILQKGVASGEFEVEDVHLAALSIGGIVGWSQVWYRSGGRLTPEEAAEGVSSLVLSMVRAKAT